MTYTKDEALAASRRYFQSVQGHDAEAAKLPASVFVDKYALRDGDVWYEATPDDMHDRLADEFARIERSYVRPLGRDVIRVALDGFNGTVPQGSPSFGIGNPFQVVSTSNCAVIAGPQDTMSSIFDTARDMANLYKRRFGVGTDLSGLRPAGARVNNAAITSTGAWSFADFYSYVTRMVGQSGRRGALMLTMDVRHPDIEQFIAMKGDLSKVTGANVSVKVSDDFMRAVANDEDYTLHWPIGAAAPKVTRVVKAKDIFRQIATMANKSAEPGVLFWDTAKRNLPLGFYPGFEPTATNPCGEVILSPNDSCRLITEYLAEFVQHEFTADAAFDWDGFKKAVRIAMRLSDDLVDIELENLRKIHYRADTDDERALLAGFIHAAEQGRRTGLGTHGLADAMARLCIRYDSDEALLFADDLYRTLKLEAYRESVNLAKERGPFPAWNPDTEAECAFLQRLAEDDPQLAADMKQYGRRNGAILTLAPTGSMSILSYNCSSGLEPMFAVSSTRNRKMDPAKDDVTGLTRDAQGDYWKKYAVFHSNVLRWMKLAYNGNVPAFNKGNGIRWEASYASEVPFEQFQKDVQLPAYFVEAGEIDWRFRVKLQGVIQSHIDHSISSTLNLPAGTTDETVEAIYMAAWEAGCKGVTVYVDGSRDQQVLSKVEAPTAEAAPEPTFTDVITDTLLKAEIDGLRGELATMTAERDRMEAERDLVMGLPHECVQRTHRGATTSGEMKKASFRDQDGNERKVYAYIGTNDDGQPVEAFVIDEQGSEELRPYASALGKLVSLALKHGVAADEVAESLTGLKGGSISYGKQIFQSVPDMVGRRLTKVQEQYETTTQRVTEFDRLFVDPAVPGSDKTMATIFDKDGVSASFEVKDLQISPSLFGGIEVKTSPLVPNGKAFLVSPDSPFFEQVEALRREITTESVKADPTPIFLDTGSMATPQVALPAPKKAIKGYVKCPSCDNPDIRAVEGCPQCFECGWGRCS